ncbi:P-loop containing nucleoside triphosphate hydrolase protein [Protomyces lactucae-debilis]|uniref:Adenylate kinase isoenzyme 6 homolog n=1 Tax=Protomyces lactucae-debilis TaxID=2754530 RepID=A0A1Y2F7W0_PROLT|nr:P-loop containing nucleoside triphosphate hydrolase protein [Protomyces lactucae-debilis]ORY79982.1 P-loop containing nucleoside triphosphate hydrolase protein [Protomyces lactucae-debilis]
MGRRYNPNIIITGTPGTGKSTHAQHLKELLQEPTSSEALPLEVFHISDLVKSADLHQGADAEWSTLLVDEDKLLDYLEPRALAESGGCVFDWHCCDIFPVRWIDLVIVLQCDHTLLWDRLQARGYALNKIQENNEAEIMQVVLDEARAAYAEEKVVVLQSQSVEEIEANVERIATWIRQWKVDHPEGIDYDEDNEGSSAQDDDEEA